MSRRNSIEVVVAIDFGTKYSSFAYSHKLNAELITNDCWPNRMGALRTNTVLQYDEKYETVLEWGCPALDKKPTRRGRYKNVSNEPVKLFKLHLSAIPDSEKPPLPKLLDYKKAITDYLREMGKLIKETIEIRWPRINFLENVLLVLTVPAEYPVKSIGILRECVYNAGLIGYLASENLQFTTEPKASAIYCMSTLRENFHRSEGKNFLIINCGEDTVDLSTHKFISSDELGDVTKHTSDFCGSNYVGKEFIKFLKRYVGDEAIKILEEQNYDQMQYMIVEFWEKVAFPFSGNFQDFKRYELDLEELCPVIKQYVTGSYKEKLEKDEWIIDIDFETMKSIFEPFIGRIVRLISGHLSNGDGCDFIFLVGDFSENRYLRKRIREEFADKVKNIAVPKQPQAAIVRGAVEYGLNMKIEKSFQWYLKLAECGDSREQNNLGDCYRNSIGITKDERKAFQWYLKSAEGGDRDGQYNLGYCYCNGIGTTKDEKKAFQWYSKSAEGGSSRGQYDLGHCYHYGIGTKKDEKEAFQWYFKSAEGGNSAGHNLLGYCYHYGIGTIKDEQKAFQWYLKSAEGRDCDGQYNLGYCYSNGIGTTKDEKKAFQWYLKTAEGGSSKGQYSLGYFYHYGIGTIKDEKKAFQWYLKSAEGGSSRGQYDLGYCYHYGIGTKKDEKEAFQWYFKSAEGGNSAGHNLLGYCYHYGIGTIKDEQKAFQCYMKSAERGSSGGQFSLGNCYRDGIGTTKDEEKAFQWYMKSAEGGNSSARTLLGFK
ncbi:hypothetical protein Glove_21g112 [Diversispora epigaea]|uniref:Uncharacterized protein n=1 Tax=Diversispora epigaea TaxID=1348612 RepID=A0A397JKE7_9GLOM|nr:hypothetical protein Glove_21g112 [Diversispora epigaea]